MMMKNLKAYLQKNLIFWSYTEELDLLELRKRAIFGALLRKKMHFNRQEIQYISWVSLPR